VNNAAAPRFSAAAGDLRGNLRALVKLSVWEEPSKMEKLVLLRAEARPPDHRQGGRQRPRHLAQAARRTRDLLFEFFSAPPRSTSCAHKASV
jgi:hypothetical protein